MPAKQHPPCKRTMRGAYTAGQAPIRGQRVPAAMLNDMDLDTGRAWLRAPLPNGVLADHLCVRQPRRGGRPPQWVVDDEHQPVS